MALVRPILERPGAPIQDLLIDPDQIRFDGSCETFHLERVCPGFDFCKTRQADYDAEVVAVLVTAAREHPALRWNSDGVWPRDHAAGLTLLGLPVAPETAGMPRRRDE